MKNFLKASFAVGVALIALSANSQAQTVAVNGLGSSAIFLELGLAASTATTASPAGLGATCLWTENTASVAATDPTVPGSIPDSGNAFVAWTPGTGTCASPVNPTIYAYLQTDSVVGNRCLFNSCTIAYPTTNPATNNLISPGSEVSLPSTIATTLNSTAINVAGTDIRPEDAEFAITRAITPCGTAVATGSQYLGLGYNPNGSTPVKSFFSGSTFNVIKFTLPASFTVTPVGATPIVVVVNSSSATTDFNASGITNLTHQVLAGYLDGTNSYTNQALTTNPTATGSAVTTIIREPLSGTYNTMEYNIPNTSNATTGLKTSQDVGVNQPAAQVNCNGTVPLSNPMNIATPSGGFRDRAIGTGQELGEFTAPTAGKITTPAVLGYGFWSVGNFKGFTSTAAPFARYLTVDGVDPLLNISSSISYSTYNGTLPLPGSAEMANVNLLNVSNGSYPIWSMLRLVNTGSTALPAVTELASTSQNFVPTGTSAGRPDFVQANNLSVVHSHFIPPAGTIQPTTAANGSGSDTTSVCTAPELGGDVGGVVIALSADSSYCSRHPGGTGQTGLRK